jgi:hypothetical protein
VLRIRDATLYEAESNPRLWDLTFMQPTFLDGTAPRREVCRDAYAIHVFNERFAEAMVERTEEFGNWTTYYRDDPVPTEDIHTEQIEWRRQWTSILRRHLSPLMNNIFTGTKFESKHQSFIVRYITTGQYELEAHQDESLVTSVVTLSNQFEGGGVTFTRYNCTVDLERRSDSHCFIRDKSRIDIEACRFRQADATFLSRSTNETLALSVQRRTMSRSI